MVTSKQCMDKFGDPTNPKNEANYMVMWDVPTTLEIGVIPKKIYCNKLMIEPLTKAFHNLVRTGCIKELKTWDGCFNVRKKRGLSSMSLHSWGLAFDVNAAWNALGAQPTLSAEFVKCLTDAGFDWGGNWARRDGMHFEIASI